MKLINLSFINKHFISKEDSLDKVHSGWGLVGSVEHTELNRSFHPFELQGGMKNNKSLLTASNLVLDFDKGLITPKDFTDRFPFAHVTITSASNTPTFPKFHVVIPVAQKLNPEEYTAAVEHLIEEFKDVSVDVSCKEPHRYYYHDASAEITCTEGAIFIPNTTSITSKTKLNLKAIADKFFSTSDEVTTSDNKVIAIKDITTKTKIICPFCDPAARNHPTMHNAFVDKKKGGEFFIYCSSENTTYWQTPVEYSQETGLYFSEQVGFPIKIQDTEVHVFKNAGDWDNFCFTNGIDTNRKKYLQRISAIWNPTKPYGLSVEGATYNLYKPSEYLRPSAYTQQITQYDSLLAQTPNIQVILNNLFDYRPGVIRNFINWLVGIHRNGKNLTAWVISTAPGAGKGVLAEVILKKIFTYVENVPSKRLMDRFNTGTENSQIQVIEEVSVQHSRGELSKNQATLDYIKNEITSKTRIIEGKGTNPYKMDNFTNYIFFSNRSQPIYVDTIDRRFNVVNNRKSKNLIDMDFFKGGDLLDSVEFDNEIKAIANYLLNAEDADLSICIKAMETEEKRLLQDASMSDDERIIQAITDKDWDTLFQTDDSSFVHPSYTETKALNDLPMSLFNDVLEVWFGNHKTYNKQRLQNMGLYKSSARDNRGRVVKIWRVK